MPPDLAEQIPWVHEACEALGVPILTYERYEADDVIGTLAAKAVDAGFEVAIVTGDKDFFQLVHDGIKVYNPQGRRHLVRRGRREGEIRRRAGAGRRRARADGRLDRQHQGRARHRRKGRARPDREVRQARELLAHAAEITNKRQREGLLEHADDARQSRELARIRDRRAGRVRSRCDALPRRLAASAASSCSRAWDSAPWSWSSRRLRRRSARTTRVVDTIDEVARARRRAAGGRPVRACACCLTRPSAMRAGIVGLSFSTAPRQARYVPMSRGLDGDSSAARRQRVPRRAADGARRARSRCSRIQRSARSVTT